MADIGAFRTLASNAAAFIGVFIIDIKLVDVASIADFNVDVFVTFAIKRIRVLIMYVVIGWYFLVDVESVFAVLIIEINTDVFVVSALGVSAAIKCLFGSRFFPMNDTT